LLGAYRLRHSESETKSRQKVHGLGHHGRPDRPRRTIRPTGVKTYVVRARPRPTDRQIMVTLGRAGTLKLAAARKAAWDALQQMQRGLNPNHEKRKLVVESFGALAEMYMAEELPQKRQGHQVARYIRADWLGQIPHQTKTWQGPRSVWKTEWKDGKDGIFRDRPAVLITREDILARLNTIRRSRGSYAARHALDAVRRVFGFAANHGHASIKVSPAASLRDKSVGLTGAMMRRQRVLTEDEIKSVWHAASDAGMFGALVKVLLVTAQRRDDWAEAKWSELSGLDGDYPLLTVPAARYKVGQTHEVPLTPLAVTRLDSLPRFAGSDWIFTINGTHPRSTFTRPKSKLDEASGVTGWTLHDLRRTGRTLMANLEVADETAERVLGHSLGGLMATYNVSRHRKQNMAALVALGAEILRIVGEESVGLNVMPLRLAS
jgi:integrase